MRILSTDRTAAGKFTLLLEIDTLEPVLFVNFLKRFYSFSEYFLQKLRTQKKILDREEKRPARELAARGARGRMLSLYRSLKGSPRDRIRGIKKLLDVEGSPLAYGQIEVDLKIARKEYRETLKQRILELRRDGKLSDREIARRLSIDQTTFRRLAAPRPSLAPMQETGAPPQDHPYSGISGKIVVYRGNMEAGGIKSAVIRPPQSGFEHR